MSLKPPGQRRPSEELIAALRDELKTTVPELQEIEFVPLVLDQINDLMGVREPIEVHVFGPDYRVLRDLATKVGKTVEGVEGTADINSHVFLGNPDIVVRPDSIQTSRLGLTEADIEAQLNAALYGQVASTVPEQDRMTKIRVRYPDLVRYNRDRLGLLPISLATANAGGGARPPVWALSRSARWPRSRPCAVPTSSRARTSSPSSRSPANLEGRDLGSANAELQAKLARMAFPAGYRWELSGQYRSQQESFTSLMTVLIVAVALVFLFLGFQFKSLALPLLIFLAQPLSLASALFALWVTGTPLNVSSFMGAILLIGLDVKNGIILIEYIGQLRAEGVPLHEALVRAGRTRFRPILMTSLCTILGLLPLAMGIGPGAQMQQPLAIAVIGGLIMNMLITRLLIPVGYLVVRGAGPRLRPCRSESAAPAKPVAHGKGDSTACVPLALPVPSPPPRWRSS